jgi:diguanylate cyclase (GGDEF)-like protein
VNLLANAIKFTPSGGHIELLARDAGSHVEIDVADTGPGVSPEEADTIFERFRQGSAGVRNKSVLGIGMGLAICKEIVVRHGGEIWALEREGGGGALFRFTLPIARTTEAQQREAVEHGTMRSRTARRILVCEDDEGHAEVVSELLRERGHRVDLARDGSEGLEIARKTHPDLVLLDVHMPEVNGFVTAERLQRDARTRDIPIVFLSASEDVAARVQGLNLGAADFLSKPFHAAELLARVERTLEQADQRRRLLALANEDSLTGVGNYRYLHERLQEEHVRARRYGTALALVMVTVQGVETINEEQGHEAGNQTLFRVGQALLHAARESDTVARYGGSDFVVLLPHARIAEANHFVERVQGELAPLCACFGVSELPPGGTGSPEDLLRAADQQLAAGKRSRPA